MNFTAGAATRQLRPVRVLLNARLVKRATRVKSTASQNHRSARPHLHVFLVEPRAAYNGLPPRDSARRHSLPCCRLCALRELARLIALHWSPDLEPGSALVLVHDRQLFVRGSPTTSEFDELVCFVSRNPLGLPEGSYTRHAHFRLPHPAHT